MKKLFKSFAISAVFAITAIAMSPAALALRALHNCEMGTYTITQNGQVMGSGSYMCCDEGCWILS